MTQWASARSSQPAAVISIVSFPAMVSLLVAMFLVLRWYWGLALLAICLFFFAAIVNRNNFAFFWKLRPLADLITVTAAAVLWIGYLSR